VAAVTAAPSERACGENMCESKVLLATAEGEKLVLEDVISIRPEAEGYRLVNLFGEEAHVRGRIKDIDLLKHRIVFESTP
jgi:predicted RNA-binding protein